MRARLTLLLWLLCAVPGACGAALHLLFPYDYLSLTEAERDLYVRGVLDARLAPLGDTGRLPWLSRCLVEKGVFQVRQVVEEQMIPSPESAGIPMPYLIERALVALCGAPRG